MENYICVFNNFHPIFILPRYKIIKFNKIPTSIIPLEWQLILMNEGSFTQNINSLIGNSLYIKMHQKFNKISINNYKNIRCIWLENSIYTKLMFARSLWTLDKINTEITSNKPLGQSLIKSNIDINKNIHEIYCGYSNYLEKNFQYNTPVWARKYTLNYNNKSSVVIQEFFSPHIIDLFLKV